MSAPISTPRSSLLHSLFGRRFWIPAYLMLGLGMVLPLPDGALSAAIPIFLGSILFFTCLRVDPRAVAGVLVDRRAFGRLATLTLAKLLAIPLAVWLIAQALVPDAALGLTLVAAMPAGLSSVALADLYGGRLPLALLVVMVTSLLCPLSVPLLMAAFTDGTAAFDAATLVGQTGYILLLLVVPFVLARVTARAAPGWTMRHRAHFGPLAIASLCALVFCAASTSRPAWIDRGAIELIETLALCTALAAGFLSVGLLARRFLAPRDAVSFACNVIYVNHGLAVAFAARFFPEAPEVLLPAVLVQIPVVAVVTVIGRLFPVTPPGR